MTARLLDIGTTNAWFKPRSYSPSWSFAYGMPWEIFRTQELLPDSSRIQTIITKAGGLRGYASQLLLIPEYGIGVIVLVAGDGRALSWLREETLRSLVPRIEEIARQQTADTLSGTYIANSDASINSSISVEVDGSSGLVMTSWSSNGTDFLARYISMSKKESGFVGSGRVQLTPSLTHRGGDGEVWRANMVPDEFPTAGVINMHLVTDVDTFTYASRSLEEFVFRTNSGGRAVRVELPGLRISLDKQQPKPVLNTWRQQLYNAMEPLGL